MSPLPHQKRDPTVEYNLKKAVLIITVILGNVNVVLYVSSLVKQSFGWCRLYMSWLWLFTLTCGQKLTSSRARPLGGRLILVISWNDGALDLPLWPKSRWSNHAGCKLLWPKQQDRFNKTMQIFSSAKKVWPVLCRMFFTNLPTDALLLLDILFIFTPYRLR